jgi:type II secretory pathway component GspD/PulD (secretin)
MTMRTATPVLLVSLLLGLSASAIAGDRPDEKPKRSLAQARISASFESQDVVDVFQYLAEAGKMNVIVSPKVKGKISIRFEDRPALAALEQAVARLGACVEREDFGIYTVMPLAERPFESQHYSFRHWRPDATVGTTALLEAGIGPLVEREGGDWRYIEAENAIAFRASKTTVRAIVSILKAMDRPAKARTAAPAKR